MVMDIKLKYAVVAVVVSVAGVYVLVMIMRKLPAGMKQDQICLPNQARDLECGFVADLLHEYVERKSVNIYAEIDTQQQTRLQETCKQSQRECGNIKPAAKLTGKKLSGIVNRNDVGADMIPITEWQDDRYLHRTSGF
ncbi:uncharacterized protein LOC123554573 [Mercenaria mercenaria]|uniref:uncharacterized protein LOC123554573 n=1 Tax=Mercenaria mercenaria TaxID=6596 RepID=UPI00234E5CE6|nr:uncharacterized protein LOC123554573 [Mercenaria mercenaria]